MLTNSKIHVKMQIGYFLFIMATSMKKLACLLVFFHITCYLNSSNGTSMERLILHPKTPKHMLKGNQKMSTKLFYNTSNCWFMFRVLIIIYLALPHESKAVVQVPSGITTARIGVIVDETTRVGKEQKTAMEIAAKRFNNTSKHLKLSLSFMNSSYIDPLQAALSATELSKKNKVKAIIGMETWQQAALVAEVGSKNQIPVISLAQAPSTLPLASQRWPFLVQMAPNYTQQISYIAAMVKCYGWKRVVAVYEDDGYAGTSMMLIQLTQALQELGSEVEHHLALPPLSVVMSTNHKPKEIILEELIKVLGKQSRIFVVLQCSLPLADHLFKEAKRIGLLGRETAWIVTESIAGLLDSAAFLSNMQGVLGIKSYYQDTDEFLDAFKEKFKKEFQNSYQHEDGYLPSIHALRAYDGITAIVNAMEKLEKAGRTRLSSEELRVGILKSNFSGLAGNISFNNVNELSTLPPLRVVNVVRGKYEVLSSQTPGECRLQNVQWPGAVWDHIPKGWAMPIDAKPLKIGVPGRADFEQMVKVEYNDTLNRTTYSGFCIDVFNEVVKILEQSYAVPYEFYPINGTYEDLVHLVYNETFDAVVGDVTILASRSKKVEFTLPYTQSGLWMIVPYNSKDSQKAWSFIKPFHWKMWVVTGALLVYTAFTIWYLEHKSNPEFSGSWKTQLNTSLWFTLSTIFFAQREKIKGRSTRIVILVWLVVVFVLTQSYTASLTSMLTVPILEPRIRDIHELSNPKNSKEPLPVGCDGDSFLTNYLPHTLNLYNIVKVNNMHAYVNLFDNHSIAAAFLDVAIARAFLSQYCKDFTYVPLKNQIGGLGFAFQKGSPIAGDVSKAILQLSESGVLKTLSDKWFTSASQCTPPGDETERLSLQGFWLLYALSGATSTLCFLLFLLQGCRNRNRDAANEPEASPATMSEADGRAVAAKMKSPLVAERRLRGLSCPTEIELSQSHSKNKLLAGEGRIYIPAFYR